MSDTPAAVRPPIISFVCLALGCYLALGFGYVLWQSDWPPFWPPMDAVLRPLDAWVDGMSMNDGLAAVIGLGAGIVLLTPILIIIGVVGWVRWVRRRGRAQEVAVS